jgi:hypothetical protein
MMEFRHRSDLESVSARSALEHATRKASDDTPKVVVIALPLRHGNQDEYFLMLRRLRDHTRLATFHPEYFPAFGERRLGVEKGHELREVVARVAKAHKMRIEGYQHGVTGREPLPYCLLH